MTSMYRDELSEEKKKTTVYKRQCNWGVCFQRTDADQTVTSAFRLRTSRSSTKTPNYRSLVASGTRLPCKPFTFSKGTSDGDMVASTESSYAWADTQGNSLHTWTTNTCPVAVLINPQQQSINSYLYGDHRRIALNRLYDHIDGAEWSLPVFVGEGRETVSMVLNLARRMSGGIRALKRGRFSEALSHLGVTEDGRSNRIKKRYNRVRAKDPSLAAAQALLQTSYGWVPLYHDVYDAAQTFAEQVVGPNNLAFKTLKASSSAWVPGPKPPISGFSGQNIGSGLITWKNEVSRLSCRFVVYYEPRDTWNSLGSFGLLNPLSVAWNLTTLSFVWDWFLPLGDFFDTLDKPLRYTFVDGLESHRLTVIGDRAVPTHKTIGKLSNTWIDIRALKLGAMPRVDLRDLTFQPRLGGNRLANGLALLRTTGLSAFKSILRA